MSLPETSEADAVAEVKQRRSGSSRQPQHFLSAQPQEMDGDLKKAEESP